MAAQEDSILKVRASEDETVAILSSRGEEEAAPQLMVSVYDVARNQKAFEQREEEEERMKMEEKMQREKEMDYLAPFLGRVRDPENLDTAQMKQVAEVGETDFTSYMQTTVNRGIFVLKIFREKIFCAKFFS